MCTCRALTLFCVVILGSGGWSAEAQLLSGITPYVLSLPLAPTILRPIAIFKFRAAAAIAAYVYRRRRQMHMSATQGNEQNGTTGSSNPSEGMNATETSLTTGAPPNQSDQEGGYGPPTTQSATDYGTSEQLYREYGTPNIGSSGIDPNPNHQPLLPPGPEQAGKWTNGDLNPNSRVGRLNPTNNSQIPPEQGKKTLASQSQYDQTRSALRAEKSKTKRQKEEEKTATQMSVRSESIKNVKKWQNHFHESTRKHGDVSFDQKLNNRNSTKASSRPRSNTNRSAKLSDPPQSLTLKARATKGRFGKDVNHWKVQVTDWGSLGQQRTLHVPSGSAYPTSDPLWTVSYLPVSQNLPPVRPLNPDPEDRISRDFALPHARATSASELNPPAGIVSQGFHGGTHYSRTQRWQPSSRFGEEPWKPLVQNYF